MNEIPQALSDIRERIGMMQTVKQLASTASKDERQYIDFMRSFKTSVGVRTEATATPDGIDVLVVAMSIARNIVLQRGVEAGESIGLPSGNTFSVDSSEFSGWVDRRFRPINRMTSDLFSLSVTGTDPKFELDFSFGFQGQCGLDLTFFPDDNHPSLDQKYRVRNNPITAMTPEEVAIMTYYTQAFIRSVRQES